MKGRKPQSTKAKQVKGNPGGRPLNENEPKYVTPSYVAPPDWLDALARECWQWYSPRLCSQRILTDVDIHNLEMFCVSYSKWRKAELEIEREGFVIHNRLGTPIKNPAAAIAHEALNQLNKIGTVLGLDPSSRSRIVSPENPAQNPFRDL